MSVKFGSNIREPTTFGAKGYKMLTKLNNYKTRSLLKDYPFHLIEWIYHFLDLTDFNDYRGVSHYSTKKSRINTEAKCHPTGIKYGSAQKSNGKIPKSLHF